MKRKLLLLMLVACSIAGFGQMDTIFSYNEKIVCLVKEVTPEAVKYVYPDEEVLNSIYKNTVHKIVFKNGRVQQFSEALSLKEVKGPLDYENVAISQVEGEVKGLIKIGEVSAKAKGTTTLSSQERVKERAYRKLKMEAALMGANVVYLLHQRDQGNQLGGYYQSGSSAETSLTGVAYANRLPDFEAFNKAIDGKRHCIAVQETSIWNNGSDLSTMELMTFFEVDSITYDNGFINITGTLQGEPRVNSFRVVSFDKEYFYVFYEGRSAAYNIKIRI